jgi:hypothetical protein
MRWLFLALVLLATPAAPVASAQEPTHAPGSVRARARPGAETTLALDNARLFVPAGAVAPGAVVALGAGGVPGPDGSLSRSGVVVSAAGGLHAPVAVLIAPRAADRATIGTATAALLGTADGIRHPCAASGRWVVCPVPRAGAYVLDATDAPPPSDRLVPAALAALPNESGTGGVPALVTRLLVIAGAAIVGGVLAWLLSRRRTGGGEPTEAP